MQGERERKVYVVFGGRNGWIGQQFAAHLQEKEPATSIELVYPPEEYRLEDTVSVEGYLHCLRLSLVAEQREEAKTTQDKQKQGEEEKEHKQERKGRRVLCGVICFAGRTHGPGWPNIDYLEQPGKLLDNVRDNLFGPVSLALLCIQMGLHCVYLGTGCIFDDSLPRPHDKHHRLEEEEKQLRKEEARFTEQDEPNYFGSSYSIVKGFTDRLMHQPLLAAAVLNLRIRMPISEKSHPRDFVTKLANYKRVIDVPNSVSVLPTLFPLIVRWIEDRRVGTINVVNPGPISHVQVLQLYRAYVDPAHVIQTFSVEEMEKLVLSQRSNNSLDTSLIEREHLHYFNRPLATGAEAIAAVLRLRALLPIKY